MSKYNVIIKKSFDTSFEVEAENEMEAEEKAIEMSNELNIQGSEMYLESSELEEL